MLTLTRGERFKDARTVHNQHGKQTMDDVQNATGVSKSLIADLENDKKDRRVNYVDVAKLAKHYGVTTDWLCCISEDHHQIPCASHDLGISEKSVYFLNALNEVGRLFEKIRGMENGPEKEALKGKLSVLYNNIISEHEFPPNKRREGLAFYAHYCIELIDNLILSIKTDPDISFDYMELREMNNKSEYWTKSAISEYDFIKFKAGEISKGFSEYFVEKFLNDFDYDYT